MDKFVISKKNEINGESRYLMSNLLEHSEECAWEWVREEERATLFTRATGTLCLFLIEELEKAEKDFFSYTMI